MSTFGKSFVQGFNPAFQQAAAAVDEMQQLKMRKALEEATAQKKREQAILDEVAQYGGTPITNPDGSLNVTATLARVMPLKAAFESRSRMAEDQAKFNQDTRNKASQLGVPVSAAPSWQKGDGSLLSPMKAQGVTEDTLPARVFGAQEQAKQNEYEAQRNAAVAAQQQAKVAGLRDELSANMAELGKLSPGDLTDIGSPDVGKMSDEQVIGVSNAIKGRLAAARQVYQANNKTTAAERNAKNAVLAGVKAGVIDPNDYEDAAAAFASNQGRAPQVPQSEREAAVGNATFINGLKNLNELVSKADPSMFGPVSFRVGSAGGKYIGGNDQLRAIEQAYNEVSSGRAFAQGGKALTPTELAAIRGQIGEPTQADFHSRITQYNDRARRDAALQLERLKASPFRFSQDGQSLIKQLESALSGPKVDAPAPAGTPALPAGWTIKK